MHAARFSPHSHQRLHGRQRRTRRLRGLHGPVEVALWYGRDPADGHWGYPLLEGWGLSARQQFTPAAAAGWPSP